VHLVGIYVVEYYYDARTHECKKRQNYISIYIILFVFFDIKQDRKTSGPNVSKQLCNVNQQHAPLLN